MHKAIDERRADHTAGTPLHLIVTCSALTAFYAATKNRQGTRKTLFHSLVDTAHGKLARIDYAVLRRDSDLVRVCIPVCSQNRGEDNVNSALRERFSPLLEDLSKAAVIVGDARSGKTVSLCDALLPWPYRYRCLSFSPPCGLWLTGSSKYTTIDAWLRSKLTTTPRTTTRSTPLKTTKRKQREGKEEEEEKKEEECDPWATLKAMLTARRREQRLRVWLHTVFKGLLPVSLRPQPVVIVVDDAEALLRAYRAHALVALSPLVQQARDEDLLRLVLVVNSERAVNALKLIGGESLFTFVRAPKVEREAVRCAYGEDFARIFDDCNGCIGVAIDYLREGERSKGITAKEYAAERREVYAREHCLTNEITKEEFDKARERARTRPVVD